MKLICLYVFRAALLLMAAGFGSMFADNIIEMRKLDQRLQQAEAEVRELRRQNMARKAESKALESDPFYIELTLRRKMRWIQPGEQQIDLAPRPKSPAANAPAQLAGEESTLSNDSEAGPQGATLAARHPAAGQGGADGSASIALGGRIGLDRRSH